LQQPALRVGAGVAAGVGEQDQGEQPGHGGVLTSEPTMAARMISARSHCPR
jgi:hypothetical protein